MSKELEALKEAVNLIQQEYQVSGHHIMSEREHNRYINTIQQALQGYEELKSDIKRFLYLQTGRISITGEFRQDFVIENKSHPLAHEAAVERNLKNEYKILKEKLELVGGNK